MRFVSRRAVTGLCMFLMLGLASVSSASSAPAAQTVWASKSYAQQQAWQQIAATPGWDVDQEYACLDNLIRHESGWNRHASNRGETWGLPQARPGNRMHSAGRDWRHNPATQIRWLLDYIKTKKDVSGHLLYETPCGAWRFWQDNHFY